VLTSEASDLLVTKTPSAPRVNNVEEKHRTWPQEEEKEKEEYRDSRKNRCKISKREYLN